MRQATIHAVCDNGNRYCGPCAVAAIAGVGTSDAARLMRKNARDFLFEFLAPRKKQFDKPPCYRIQYVVKQCFLGVS